MTFIEWLSHEMAQRDINQAELADRAEVTRGAISHIFSGTRRPGIEMLQSLARALALPTEQVFRAAGLLDDGPYQLALDPPPADLGEWIYLFKSADEQTREIMLDNARFFSQRAARQNKA